MAALSDGVKCRERLVSFNRSDGASLRWLTGLSVLGWGASRPSGPRRLPVARQHPDDEDGHARADEERSRRRAEAGAEQTRHGEHEDDSNDEFDHPMDRKGDHLNEAKRKAREKCHQEMDDREPPSDGRHVATEPEEKWREKENSYGDEIEKAMETRVQKIHELIIARPGRRRERERSTCCARPIPRLRSPLNTSRRGR